MFRLGQRRINLSVSTNQAAVYNLKNQAGNPTDRVDVYLTLSSGAVLERGLVVSSLPSGSRVYIDTGNGTIAGEGGAGNQGAGASIASQSFIPGGSGGNGGDAIVSDIPLTITNANGFIFGGGGGGGAGAARLSPTGGPYTYEAGGGGGGGGRGYYSIGGAGGQTDTVFNWGLNGVAGTSAGAGAGGAGGDSGAGGAGGAGGDWATSGSPGGSPAIPDSSGIGAGGAGGYAVRTNGQGITWISGNDATHVKGSQN